MRRTSCILFLLLVSAASVVAELDLTPVVSEYSREGFTYTRLTFKADGGQITLNPPPKWSYRGAASRLQLIPPGSTYAEGVIEAVAADQRRPIGPEAADALGQEVLAGVPPASQAVELVRRVENPFLVHGNPTYEVVISYKALGETFVRSVIFGSTANTQLIIRFTARKEDFDGLNEVFRRSVASWQWIEHKPRDG